MFAHPVAVAAASLPLVALVDRKRELGLRIGIALPLGWGAGKLLKNAFPRQKPRLLTLTPRQSFPSGHTIATTVLAASLVDTYRAWRAAPLAVAGIALVGAARVHAREHRVSEVLAGVAIGLAASITAGLAARYAARVAQRRADARRAAAP